MFVSFIVYTCMDDFADTLFVCCYFTVCLVNFGLHLLLVLLRGVALITCCCLPVLCIYWLVFDFVVVYVFDLICVCSILVWTACVVWWMLSLFILLDYICCCVVVNCRYFFALGFCLLSCVLLCFSLDFCFVFVYLCVAFWVCLLCVDFVYLKWLRFS